MQVWIEFKSKHNPHCNNDQDSKSPKTPTISRTETPVRTGKFEEMNKAKGNSTKQLKNQTDI